MSDFSNEPWQQPGPPPPPPPPSMAPPPGYVPYGGQAYGAFSSFRPVSGIAKWMQGLIIALIPLQLLSVALLAGLRSKARDYLNGSISADDYTHSALSLGLVGLLVGVCTVSLVVLTMIWMSRLAKNAQLLNRVGTWTSGWAVAGWFCPPCILYVIPYLMFKDLWKASDPQSGNDWRQNPVSGLVHLWWVLYGLLPIAFITVNVGSFRFGSTTDAAKRIDRSFALSLGSSAVQACAAITFLLLVKQLTARHRQVTHES